MMAKNIQNSTICYGRSNTNLHQQIIRREMGLSFNLKSFSSNLFHERYRVAKNLYKTNLEGHYGCVNAIEFSYGGKFLASGGDDKRVLVWNVEKSIAGLIGTPQEFDTQHHSNIFCLCFDNQNEKLMSGGNDDLVIVHDFLTGKLCNIYKHDSAIYGLTIHPQQINIFATASDDGRISIYDQRTDPRDPLILASLQSPFHAVQFHPVDGNFLITANSKRGAAFWDMRKPNEHIIQYGYADNPPSCMSVRFNSDGSLILALRRRLPPILYNTKLPDSICTFFHDNYYNSCTMKSCTFAGEDDELVLSGSDDFNLYVWRLSDIDFEQTDQWIENTQMVLYGHRSIVNQVRYNRERCLLASSGVEKIIKLWSPFQQKDWTGSLLEEANCSDNPRDLYSQHILSSPGSHNWSQMSQDDYSNRNTSEDPRMMAFFDSLIQQEIEGWGESQESESDSDKETIRNLSLNSEIESSSDEELINNNEDEDDGGNSFVENEENSENRTARAADAVVVEDVNVNDDDEEDGDDGEDDDDNHNGIHIGTRGLNNPNVLNLSQRRLSLQSERAENEQFNNRIAYLISTKRGLLRKLALRDKRRSVNQRNRDEITSADETDHSENRSSRVKKKLTKSQRSKFRRYTVNETSSDEVESENNNDDENSGNDDNDTNNDNKDSAGEDSCNTNENSNGNDNENDMGAVASTSTGIVSSLKEAMVRFRHHQQEQNQQQERKQPADDVDDDDDDDDDDDGANGNLQSQNAINRVFQQTALTKINGVINRRVKRVPQNHLNAMVEPVERSINCYKMETNPFSAEQMYINCVNNRNEESLPSPLSAAVSSATVANTVSPSMCIPKNSKPKITKLPQTDGDDVNNYDDNNNNNADEDKDSKDNHINNCSRPCSRRKCKSINSSTNSTATMSSSSSSASESTIISSRDDKDQSGDIKKNIKLNNKRENFDSIKEHLTTPIKKRKMTANHINVSNNGNTIDNSNEGSTDVEANSDNSSMKRKNGASIINLTPDSGVSVSAILTSEEKPTTSRVLYSPQNDKQLYHLNQENEVFQRKIAKLKRNYRKHFANDSDTN